MRFTIRLFSVLSALLFLVTSCGKKSEADSKAKSGTSTNSGVVIGVSLLTRTHPFYQDLERGLQETADANGYTLLITAGEFDVAKQKDQVQDFIVRKVNAIILAPCDSRSIGTAVKAANDAGIPVFTADIACLAEGVQIVSHIASDNEAGGHLAAQALALAIGQSGEVAIIDHPEVESVIQRVKGFEDELAANFPNIKIVAKLSGHGVKDQAFRTAEDIVQANPSLKAIFGINDDSALGALAAVEKAGKLGSIQIVGFDAIPEARSAINAGKIYADVIQKPHEIGQKTIEAVKSYMSGVAVSATVLVPCGLFTKEAVN